MLGSDSGSSDLSEVDSSSSSSSEEDLTLDHRIPNNKNIDNHSPQQASSVQRRASIIPPNLTPPKKRLPQSAALYRNNSSNSAFPSSSSSSSAPATVTSGKRNISKKYTSSQVVAHASSSSSLSSSESDSASDLSDGDGADASSFVAGTSQKSRGKRLPLKSKLSSSKQHDSRDSTVPPRGVPISLTDSQPVYSQQVMDGSLLLPAHVRYNQKSAAQSKSSRGGNSAAVSRSGGKKSGGVRSLLSGGKISKAKGAAAASETVVIDFDEDEDVDEGGDDDDGSYMSLGSNDNYLASLPPTSNTTLPVSSKATTTKTGKKPQTPASAKSKEKKPKAKKGKKPSTSKQKDQELYCICRSTYDGSEFMIACDRCEEWFHGRCIGVKPQAAKKTTHFYCQDCQATMNQPQSPLPAAALPIMETLKKQKKNKSKDKDKKTKKKKFKGLHNDTRDVPKRKASPPPPPSSLQKQMHFKEEEEAVAIDSSEDETFHASQYQSPPTTHHSPAKQLQQEHLCPYQDLNVYGQSPSEWQSQQRLPYAVSSKIPAAKTPQLIVQPSYPSPPQPAYSVPPSAPLTVRLSTNIASMDDEDEDVCPVCEFECTCAPQTPVYISPPLPQASPAFASKAPMPAPQPLRSPHRLEQESVSVGLSFQESPVESFQSAHKSPMVTPGGISHRRPSISRMGGKGIGKAPVVLKAVKSQIYSRSSQGKSLKSSKVMQYYRHLLSSSGSEEDESDIDSDDEIQGNKVELYAHKKKHVVRQDRHSQDHHFVPSAEEDEEEGVEENDIDEVLSLSSSSSLSDSDDGAHDNGSLGDGSSTPITTGVNSTKGSKWIAKDVGMNQILSPKLEPSVLNATSPPPLPTKRMSGRTKKRKDSLGLTNVDEDNLYTPAVASSRHQRISGIFAKAHTRSPSKKVHKARRGSFSDLPVSKSAVTMEDNQLSRALGGIVQEDEKVTDDDNSIPSDDDIFGDGELSEAPSDDYFDGDLTDDIEAFDDLDDEDEEVSSQLFETSDDLESITSGGPHEYHYSDLEEDDEESLVDSDSSSNAMSQSDSADNGSETSTDSEIEPPQPAESPEEDVDVADELDEEELLRLAEEERRIVQRAHLLQEYLSEEDEEEADPDRNPFESSEEEDTSVDEYEFDADGEGHEDDYFDDEDDYYFDDAETGHHLNLVYDEYKGTKLEMQALMMIPPEQQEQLLLLQHYAEQQQQKLQQQEQQPQDQGQSHDALHAPLQPISEARDPAAAAFFIGVPDLDAVSEQLAQSLATSMASGLAGSISEASPPEDTSALSTPLPNSVPPTPTHPSTLMQAESPTHATTSESVSPTPLVTTASVSLPAAALAALPSPGATTPTSATSASIIMPTPANTPTPPSGNEVSSKSEEDEDDEEKVEQKEPSASQEPTIIDDTPFKAQVTNPACSAQSETAAAGLAATIPTSTLSSQEFLASLDTHTAELLAKTLEHTSAHLEAAAGDVSPLPHILLDTLDFNKRKSEQLGSKGVEKELKRRRTSLSTSTSISTSASDLLPEIAALASSVPTTGSGDLPELGGVPKGSSNATHSALANLLTSTSASALTPALISMVTTAGKLDPQQVHGGRRASVRSSKDRRLSKVEQQDPTGAEEPMPMDDLLDTSALYGEHGDDEKQHDHDHTTGIPPMVSKDLSRWEKVPIGTFRRSRRPSSPYIGLQGAIKSGRQDIESALLSAAAAHPPHQREIAPHDVATIRRGSRGVGMRRYRSNPASLSGSDIQAIMQQGSLKTGDSALFPGQVGVGRFLLRPMHHLRSASQLPSVPGNNGASLNQEALMALMGNTPPTIHAGMMMEELSSLGSPKGLIDSALPSLGGSVSSSSSSTHDTVTSGSDSWRRVVALDTMAKLTVAPTGPGLHRSATMNDLAQDSRYHSLSMVGSSVASRRRRMTKSQSQHSIEGFKLSQSSSSLSSSRHRGRRSQDASSGGHISSGGLGINIAQSNLATAVGEISHDLNKHSGGGPTTEDVMTDASQLPSSACPTPLHSPLFSATASGTTGVTEDAHHHKDAVIPPLALDQTVFAKLSTSPAAATGPLSLHRVAEEDDEEIDIDDDTDVDAIWRATFGHAEGSAGKPFQRT